MLFKKEKEYDYFDYFVRSTEFACKAATYLHESLTGFHKDDFYDRMVSMHEIENNADNLKHDMMQHLLHEFIPPIEREDIVSLAQQLDNVVDAIDDVMLRIDMFCISDILPGAIEFSMTIIRCCNELLGTVNDFRSFKSSKKIRDNIVAVNSLESEGDKLHSECIKALYRDPKIDAKTLVAWSSIYDDLEMCLDACEHCTDIIETVIMKNSEWSWVLWGQRPTTLGISRGFSPQSDLFL